MSCEEKLEKWEFLIKEGKRAEADKLYNSEILPDLCKHFRDRYSHKYKDKNLICLVGTSPSPLILTIHAVQPKRVFFIYSSETEEFLNKVSAFCKLKHSQVTPLLVDSSTPTETYKAIYKISKEVDPLNIILDISGGKKSMVGGAAMAAAILGCTVTYVDSSEYLKDLRRPKAGTERLIELENPYKIFGDVLRHEANKLFNAGWYQEACRIYNDLQKKVRNGIDLEIRSAIAATYQNWMNYDFKKAASKCNQALMLIKRHGELTNHCNRLEEQLRILQQLEEEDDDAIFILNHYYNALRFAGRERYDFAALLLYRTLEMVFASRLKKYGIDVNKPDYNSLKIPRESLIEKYVKLKERTYKAGFKPYLPEKIGFMDGMFLLVALEDTLMLDIDTRKVFECSNLRNKSILAHGKSMINAKEFYNMKKSFEKMIDKYIALEHSDENLSDYAETFQFIEFKDNL